MTKLTIHSSLAFLFNWAGILIANVAGAAAVSIIGANHSWRYISMDTIDKKELLKKIQQKESFQLVDVRDTPDYRKEHIVGAVHLLIAEMSKEKVEELFNKHDLIVTYSLDIDCPAKNIAAKKLMDFGFSNVKAYQGSWMDWKGSGYPVEKG
jgi:rhodanese-related sulfurtransferase